MVSFSRREFLAGASFTGVAVAGGLVTAACSRKRAKRYQGWLFVASAAARGIVVANLAQFRRMTTIPLPHAPDWVFAGAGRLWSVSHEGAELIEINSATLAVSGRVPLPGRPLAARPTAGGKSLLIALESPAELIAFDLEKRGISGRAALPGPAVEIDINGDSAAAVIPSRNAVVRVSAADLRLAGATDTGVPCQTLRFRNDGRTILAGSAPARQVVTLDAITGQLLAKLPLPVAPARFCFNPDGGQMFVTGAGEDSVVIVSPYQNEVGETVLAGRTPEAMAVSAPRDLLFVTNRESGDLTILDIDTRQLAASVHVGGTPREVLLTTDDQYALVLDTASGSVAVIHVDTVLDRRVDIPAAATALSAKPLFTTFATAGDARSSLILPSPLAA